MSQKEAENIGMLKKARPDMQILAIGGGKGGVGKSLVSANLAIALTRRQKRVVLVDADFGGANAHTCLGIAPPTRTLGEFVERKVASLAEIAVPTPYSGLTLISGALDDTQAANPKFAQKLRLLKDIVKLDADFVIIDLGAGTGVNTLDMLMIADHALLTLLPEPTSIENAYRFVKAAFVRRMKNLGEQHQCSRELDALMADTTQPVKTPADLMARLKLAAPKKGAAFFQDMLALKLHLVLNQARQPDDTMLVRNMRSACQRYFGVPFELSGTLPYDNAVWQAVRSKQSLATFAERMNVPSSVTAAIEELASVFAPALTVTAPVAAPHTFAAVSPNTVSSNTVSSNTVSSTIGTSKTASPGILTQNIETGGNARPLARPHSQVHA